jgi:hypothetical protein
MDIRVAKPRGRRAPFGSDILIPGLPDEVVLSVVWLKLAARLYFLNVSMPEAEVCDII